MTPSNILLPMILYCDDFSIPVPQDNTKIIRIAFLKEEVATCGAIFHGTTNKERVLLDVPRHFLTRQFLTQTFSHPTFSHPTIPHTTIYHPTISHFKYIILGQFLTSTVFQPTLSHPTVCVVFCDNISPIFLQK